MYGKAIAVALVENKLIRELDLSYSTFEHPKCFYDISMAINNEMCRLNVLRLKGLKVKQMEAKILQFMLMKNKQLTTLDLSFAVAMEEEVFPIFMQKFNDLCNIRCLLLEGLLPDPE